MDILKIVIVILLFITLIFTGLVYQVGSGIDNTVLNKDYYRDLSEEIDLFAHVHGEIEEKVNKHLQEELAEEFPEAKSPEEFEFISEAFLQTINPEWLEEESLEAIEEILLLAKEGEEISMRIDLEERGDVFRSNLEREMEKVADEWFTERGTSRREVAAMAESAFEEELPSEVDLGGILAEEREKNEDLDLVVENISGGLQSFDSYFHLAFYLTFLAFLILFVVLVGTRKGLMGFGSSIMISGLIFSGILFTIRSPLIEHILAEIKEETPIFLGGVIPEILVHFSGVFLRGSLLFAFVGLAFLAAGFIWSRVKD